MKILVVGGTGTVGSRTVRALLDRGAEVSVLTRDAGKPLPDGVRPVQGDLLDPGTIRTVFRGMDGVFLVNAVSVTEAHEGLMAVNGVRMAGVRNLVYMSVHGADRAPHLPHFGAKLGIEAAVRASGVPYTILRPNHFFQNDLWFKDLLLGAGIYPQPLGSVGVSRVDVRDIAEAAAEALVGGGQAGQTYNLVGPEAVTGTSTAEVWSRALGRPVAYIGDDLDAWEEQSLAMLPAWMVFDFKEMFRFFQEHGLKGEAEDVERMTALLGHAPRSLEDFAAETAAAWRA